MAVKTKMGTKKPLKHGKKRGPKELILKIEGDPRAALDRLLRKPKPH